MVRQLPEDARDDPSDSAAVSAHGEVRHTLVERCALAHQRGESYRRILRPGEQRPIRAAPDPPGLLRHRRLQVHHGAVAAQRLSVFRQQYGAAARRQNDAVPRDEIGDDLPLTGAEPGLAFLVENQRNVDTGALLDLGIRIDERQTERRASCLPTAVLPEPIGPTRKMLPASSIVSRLAATASLPQAMPPQGVGPAAGAFR